MTKASERAILVLQVLSLAASALFVWVHSIAPRLERQSLSSIVSTALFYVLVAWALTALIAFYIRLVVRSETGVEMSDTLRSSAVAMWFGPAIILLCSRSLTWMTVGVVLLVNTTRLLVDRWMPARVRHPGVVHTGLLFARVELQAPLLTWHFGAVLTCAFLIQSGFVAALWGRSFLASGFVAVSIAALTSVYLVSAPSTSRTSNTPPSALSIALTFLLAATISTGGIQIGGDANSGSDFEAKGSPRENITPLYAAPRVRGGDMPGVVLRPDAKTHPPLTAPVPISAGNSGSAMTKPLVIPFSGEYWMFRAPWKHPPFDSPVRKGSPLDFSFHTSDSKVLQMEAHQKLDPAIDLSCCSTMQVVMAAGAARGILSVEVILTERAPQGRLIESLGSSLPLTFTSASQNLNFPLARAKRVSKFDEITVVFHRDVAGMERSAPVAIQRFVMVPRGL